VGRATDKGIIVEWQVCPDRCKEAGDTLGFSIERRKGSEAWRPISENNYKKTSYLDTDIEAGNVYDYRVTPYYQRDGVTFWGKPFVVSKIRARAKVLPPPPESVWVVPGKEGLEVHWLEPKGRIAGYNVYRKQSDGSIVRLNGKPVAHSPYIDKTALPNQVYGYAVSSVSSDPSATEGVTSSWIEIRNVFMKDKN
jgi:fibronectin type 3 domain-containing protein